MDSAFLAESLLYLIVLVLSLTVHEFFHAWTAWKLGDDTAARMGRLTLNPIPHVDLVGTILLPLMHAPIGWAKPVPVNPSRFRRGVKMSTGDILVSVAGPLSNLGLGLLSAVLLGLLARFVPEAVAPGGPGASLLWQLMVTNCGLAVFNILPVPPLDGSHVAGHFVPRSLQGAWEQFSRVAPFLLLVVLVIESRTHTPLLFRVIGPPMNYLFGILRHVAGALAG